MGVREMKSSRLSVRSIALLAIMIAVTCVFTLIKVPIPGTRGYIHFGDIAANFAAIAFGPWLGLLIAGGGTGLADIASGYAVWAPFTLVIHGLQGFVVGYLALLSRHHTKSLWYAVVIGEIIMIVGYFLAGWWLEGFNLTVFSIPFNAVQGLVGLIGMPLFIAVSRAYPPLLFFGGSRDNSDRDR